jgi:hypothetical protein
MSQRISSMRASIAHASARPSNRWDDIARSFLFAGGSAIGLSATGAWGKAAAGDRV